METKSLSFNPFARFFDKYRIKKDVEEDIKQNAQGMSQEEIDSAQYDTTSGLGPTDNLIITSIDFEQAFKQKATRIAKYREMSNYPEVADATDYVCDEAIVDNEEGEILSLDIKDDKIPKSLQKKMRLNFEYLVNDVFQFNDRGWDFFRKWLVESELYLEVVMNDAKDNIIGIKQLPGYSMFPIYDHTILKGFCQVQRPNMSDYADIAKKEMTFAANQIIYSNYGLYGVNLLDVRGYYESAVRTYNQLKNLEDAVVVYRLVRAPERKIWNIYTGKMPKGKAEEYIQQMINRYKKKLMYDTETGKIDSAQNVQGMTEDFWFSKDDSGHGTEIQTIGGAMNLGEMKDIEYFLKKLYKVLKLPRSRYSEDSGGSIYSAGRMGEITREEVKFSRFIERLQKRFSKIIMDPFITLLKMKGIDEDYLNPNKFNIKFTQSNMFKEYKELNLWQEKLGILGQATSYIATEQTQNQPQAIFAKEFVVRKYFNMADVDFDENERLKKLQFIEEKKHPEGNGFGGGFGGDQFGNQGGDQFGGQDQNQPYQPLDFSKEENPEDEEEQNPEKTKEEDKEQKKKMITGGKAEKRFVSYLKS